MRFHTLWIHLNRLNIQFQYTLPFGYTMYTLYRTVGNFIYFSLILSETLYTFRLRNRKLYTLFTYIIGNFIYFSFMQSETLYTFRLYFRKLYILFVYELKLESGVTPESKLCIQFQVNRKSFIIFDDVITWLLGAKNFFWPPAEGRKYFFIILKWKLKKIKFLKKKSFGPPAGSKKYFFSS